ncbi:sugar phosphate isomerase/epimerase family protein [Armatimonas rosea]|uniref:Sugar phosphate isomerase/epimerase n=1 Tax=Armatimonas rosea TaxID=685828 RepID=A0A7W9W8H8_ARMRO|nr:sugar phosphate isomerase/epimerase [Armatimonas rosea]MBB6053569.1 sugar phosphate isomerase/epimerase [Armatimonas rosea]
MTQLGIQLIIFGKRGGEDLPGVLADVKAAGYDGAEVGNPTTSIAAYDYKQLFDDAGLACAGYHTGVSALTDLDHVRETAAHMNIVGARHLMAGGKWPDAAGYEDAARTLNAAGEVLESEGIRLCYHNHNWELFALPEGGTGMEILLHQTDPGYVNFCFDLFWVACGGEDLVSFLQTYGHRADYLHYKDGTFDPETHQPLTFTELGNGQVKLVEAHRVVQTLSPTWITTEQDRVAEGGSPAASAKLSADYARGVLGV